MSRSASRLPGRRLRAAASLLTAVLGWGAPVVAAPPASPTPAPVASAALLAAVVAPPAVAQEFLVTGRFEYEDKAWDEDGWTGEDPLRPVRWADVVVTDAATGKVLGRGATDDEGEFAVACRSKRPTVDLAVRVEADTRTRARAEKPFPRLRVVSPGASVYAAFAPDVPGHPVGTDVDVGTTTVLKTDVSGREGNPFNVLDLAVAAFEYVTGPEVGFTKRGRSLRLAWPSPTGSFAIGRRAWIATSDGYDDAVILHEVGHLVHNVYSDSDNPGGIHFFGDSDQDLRLAFGEGWATAFAGIVLDRLGQPACYVDANGSAQVGGAQLALDLETAAPYDEVSTGAADEIAVACVLYDLLDGTSAEDAGFDDDLMATGADVDGLTPTQALWDVLAGPLRRARKVNVNHAWDAWLEAYAEPEYSRLVDVYEDRALDFWADAFEPDGDPEDATPVALLSDDVWAPDAVHTLYAPDADGPGPGPKDRDWFAVDLVAGQRVEVETRYPGGAGDAGTQADPLLVLFDPSGKRVARDDDSGAGRNARISDIVVHETGTWRFLVRTRNKLHRYGRYEVRVRELD